ncbi:succinate dehydrogenase [Paralcaligenes sp. KSB-10]|uniref:succinate dehydrogenase n=1 Tax=Paralcaligenes sp. KSB-10 TaxID=2901142 RepID=UPI001E459694|nr:succinate dehydrogenase [Paralcaligenes sp. KSB-10]UHL62938.1 succinate dehydrogenase [Paralcaligenes sp. KSB-10]
MTTAAHQARRWYWQRISAMVLAICVLVHIGVIIYAVRGGLTAAEILGRTQGNWWVGVFYGIFVLACTVHVPIGLAKIAEEWLAWPQKTANMVSNIFGVAILFMGFLAVYAVLAS